MLSRIYFHQAGLAVASCDLATAAKNVAETAIKTTNLNDRTHFMGRPSEEQMLSDRICNPTAPLIQASDHWSKGRSVIRDRAGCAGQS